MTVEINAILVALHIQRFSNRCEDRVITNNVNATFGIKQRGRYIKEELLDNQAVCRLNSLATAARNYLKRNTLPWQDGGMRILSTSRMLEVLGALQSYKEEDEALVKELDRDYEMWIDRARQNFGQRFSLDDYPVNIRDMYKFQVRTFPVGDIADIRLNVSNEEKEKLRASMEESLRASMKDATIECLKRIKERCKKILEILGSPLPNFKDATIESASEVIANIVDLDVTKSSKIKYVGDLTASFMNGLIPEAIRKNRDYALSRIPELVRIIDTIDNAIEELADGN